MMKVNITLRVDEELAREAKIYAARRGTSVSQMVADQLEEMVRRDGDYEKARNRALRRLNQGLDLNWEKPADRGELYER